MQKLWLIPTLLLVALRAFAQQDQPKRPGPPVISDSSRVRPLTGQQTGRALSQGANVQINGADYEVVNRTPSALNEAGKTGVRLSAGTDAGVAWLEGKNFREGTIEFDVRGKDEFQKSFVGIAFHGADNRTYEAVYFRPFNFRSTDPVRRVHAVQYVFEPHFGFQKLRDTRKDEFESAIRPVPEPTGWIHAKIETRAGRVKVYVNGAAAPCLDVPTLNPAPTGQRIGFWVGNNSDGEFANLNLSPTK